MSFSNFYNYLTSRNLGNWTYITEQGLKIIKKDGIKQFMIQNMKKMKIVCLIMHVKNQVMEIFIIM